MLTNLGYGAINKFEGAPYVGQKAHDNSGDDQTNLKVFGDVSFAILTRFVNVKA